MPKKAIAAAAVSLAIVTALITLLYPFVDRGALAEPSFDVDEAEGKARLDSQIVVEVRGSFSEEEIRESLQIRPSVPIEEQDLAVEHIARFPWHEGFPWAKTRVAINPGKSRLFEPETSYTVALDDQYLTFETITLPRVASARVESAPGNGFTDVPTSSPIVLVFNEEVVWQDEWLDVKPHAEVVTTTEEPSEAGTELWVIPKDRWENSTTYTLTIREGVRDVFGHEGVEGSRLRFTTWRQPRVIEAAPMGSDLAPDSTVRVEFERPVDRRTVEEAFAVEPSASGNFEWANNRVMKWKPSGLRYSTTYTVSVGGKTIGGDPILPSRWAFTTRSQPAVVEAYPTGNSLPLDSSVRIAFSRQVDRQTVEQAFQIEPDVGGSFDWESDLVLTWKPLELQYSTTYTLSAGGKSIDGDPIVPYEWPFTTQDPPVFVEIAGGSESPTTLTAVASGGTGEYSYQWNTGEISQEIGVALWYEEDRAFAVTVASGDQATTADMLVHGPPSPCPPNWKIVSEEVCYKEETLPGPVRTFVARVDLGDPDVQISAGPTADHLGHVRAVSQSAVARNTIVSTNGDFFGRRDGAYFTLGPIVSGGNFIYAPDQPGYGPDLPGVVFALDRDGDSWVGQERELKVSLKSSDGTTINVQHINSIPEAGELALFNAYWGTQLSLPVTGCHAVFAPIDGKGSSAKAFSCGAVSNIPLRTGEFVLVGRGTAAEWMKQHRGQPLSFETSFPLENIDFAVGGSHALIQNGLSVEELNPYLGGKHPRTAIGIDGEGFLYFVVVDGRSPASGGMTLVELQRYLSGLGLVNAINLDGGGSSTIVLEKSVMNTPSDGRERSVSAVVEVTGPRKTCWHGFVRC